MASRKEEIITFKVDDALAEGFRRMPNQSDSVRSLAGMMAVATLLSALFTSAGMMISYSLDLPSGSVIIVFAGLVYLVTLLLRSAIRTLRRSEGVTALEGEG